MPTRMRRFTVGANNPFMRSLDLSRQELLGDGLGEVLDVSFELRLELLALARDGLGGLLGDLLGLLAGAREGFGFLLLGVVQDRFVILARGGPLLAEPSLVFLELGVRFVHELF